MTTAYASLGTTWAQDATPVYGPLAAHLIARSPVPLAGALVLDAGAGTGAAGEVLRRCGARVIAADLEPDMLAAAPRPAVAADVTALPFHDDAFDVAVAAFVINHLPHPWAGLAALRRVVRPGGPVLVSSFALDRAPAKSVVDAVAAAYGFRVPEWYTDLQDCAVGVGTVEALAAALRAAGFTTCEVTTSAVDVGLADAADVVRYRLALPHLHRWIATLPEATRRAFVAEAAQAVAATGVPFAPTVVEAVALS